VPGGANIVLAHACLMEVSGAEKGGAALSLCFFRLSRSFDVLSFVISWFALHLLGIDLGSGAATCHHHADSGQEMDGT